MSTMAAAPLAVPGLRRNMVTICAMTPTIMQALDTTIATVAAGDAGLLFEEAPRKGDVDLGHGREDGPDHGAVAGRLAERDLFLALGVLCQPAVRHLHRPRPAGLHGRDPEGSRPSLRLV